jgi:2-hydroxy-3-oxopropionate reductase
VAEAVTDADVVLTMLPDSPDAEAVVLGDDGVLAHARPRSVWIDASTIRPDVAIRLGAAAGERAIRAVDAPVSGGEAGAVEASLSIMVSGAAADVASARPVLEAPGSTVVHIGPAGSGQTVKAANQLIVAGTIELVAEALVFLDAHGVDLHHKDLRIVTSAAREAGVAIRSRAPIVRSCRHGPRSPN